VLEPFAHPAADGRPIIEPRFDAPARRTPTDGPVVPDGAPLDVERFFDVASPEGVVLPFDIAWPGDSLLSPAGRGLPTPAGGAGKPLPDPLQRARSRSHEPRQPPEYLGSIGGEAERRLLEAPRVEEPKIIDLPPAPVPPGFASPEKPKGKEPRAPGQEACTTDPFYVFPPVEQFLFTPQPPQSRGKGGPPPLTSDPCPCVCKCVPYANTVSAFVLAGRQEEEEQATGKRERRVSSKLPRAFFDMFATDTTTILGVPVQPGLVISTPDGFVEHVRDVVARRDTVGYGAGSSAAPGSVAPLDGLSATFAARQPAPATAPRLLWPELDGTLVAPTRVAAPVGPGPGIPGIGAQSLVPTSGPPFRSAPGALPAGLAPAGDGFVMDSNGRVS
jgi:hypothetical protein